MATKTTSFNSSPHTAGIFADLSIDGPEIGTLVAIVDRAKNLPNRKTIGKQDPYCHMRLGKHAKKTATDVRGGQTPRWDQELRFIVHDGPDYYQLKVSIFTDDKRTDLIGEAWIDLKKIIVQGGGQDDVWQQLTCRGKYAGEIRLEITFYDTRPKPDRPAPKPRAQSAMPEQENGSVKSRTSMKRRPLPSDPVTGEAPVTPPVQQQPSGPPKPSPVQDSYQTPPRAHAKHGSHSGFISNQSPLQSVEYQTPPSAPRYAQDQYSPSVHGQAPTPPSMRAELPRQSYHSNDPYNTSPRHHDERDYSPAGPPSFAYEPRGQAFPEHFDHLPPPVTETRQLPSIEDDRPPPPPAHRSSFGTGQLEMAPSRNFDMPAQKSTSSLPMRHDVLRNEAHRHSISTQPVTRPAIRAYDSAPPVPQPAQALPAPSYEPPRHHSHGPASYDAPSRSMQATVEDAPESPNYGQPYRQNPRGHPDDPSYDYGSSPAPLNLSRSPGASPLHQIESSREFQRDYDDHAFYGGGSPSAGREFSTSPGRPQPQPHNNQGQYSHYSQEYDRSMQRVSGRELPSSLIPGGVDPSLTQEIVDRIQDDRRHHDRRNTTQVVGTPPRGRFASEPPPSYPDRGEMVTYQPPQPQYDHRPRHGSDVSYSGGPNQSMPEQRMRRPSPSPPASSQQMIKRKSVSPAPPPAENRRHSGVPFGPDSFDSFNTNLATREEQRGPAIDPDAKIVTHDGREVDPSDHLPMESWAPEPEKKDKQPSPEPRARPSPGGAQPMPPSGRRQLRIAARPSPGPAAPHPSFGPSDPQTPPVQAGRNRLHKKTRSSVPAGAGSSPLAPTPDNYQDRGSPYNTTPTRGAHRSSMAHYDYPNENHFGSAPPIPAKVPIGHGNGAMMSGGLGDDAMMHEMSRIDLGAGRSSRRRG